MNPERFQDTPAGRVIKTGPTSAPYWAFVPHPLPPDLAYHREFARILSAADRAMGELAGLGRTLPNPHLLVRPFIQREAVLSSRIEGTRAEITDLYGYQAEQLPLPGLGSGAPEADVREVVNYVEALEYGLQRLAAFPLSLRLMREIHARLLGGVRGEHATPGQFRTSQNWIGPPGAGLNEARYVPPPVAEMEEALYAFESYLHTEGDHPPLVRLALIHYQFEAIHPFIDGNGRIGRLLVSLLTVHWNLLPLPLLYLSAYFHKHRDAYYDLLLAVSERGAWEEWVRFFLVGVAEQAEDAAQRARDLQDLQQAWQERLAGKRTSANLLRLADTLLEQPMLTIPQAQEKLGVTYRAAANNVERLVEAGILVRVGEESHPKIYAAPEIIEILSAEL